MNNSPSAIPAAATPASPEPASLFQDAHQYGSSTGLAYAGAVTPAQAWQLASSGAAAIVDVRSRYEHEFVGRIPGSALIEWRIYEDGSAGNGSNGAGVTSRPNPAFLDQLRAAHAPDQPLLLLCRSAVRSHNAAIAATAAGFTRVYNILEGFEGDKDASGRRNTLAGWRHAGLPWVQG